MKVYAMFDSAAQVFGQPIFAASTGVLVRSLGDQVNAPARDNQFAQHPEDYMLYELGRYDETNGQITMNESISVVSRCKDLVRNPS